MTSANDDTPVRPVERCGGNPGRPRVLASRAIPLIAGTPIPASWYCLGCPDCRPDQPIESYTAPRPVEPAASAAPETASLDEAQSSSCAKCGHAESKHITYTAYGKEHGPLCQDCASDKYHSYSPADARITEALVEAERWASQPRHVPNSRRAAEVEAFAAGYLVRGSWLEARVQGERETLVAAIIEWSDAHTHANSDAMRRDVGDTWKAAEDRLTRASIRIDRLAAALRATPTPGDKETN